VRFGVLGPIDVEVDGVSIPIVGPQQRRLASLLVAERGRVVSTDRLVDALWPDGQAPDGAQRSVLTYVSRLRATLGGTGIVTSPPGYLLQVGTGSCDADEFEALLDEGDRALPERALDCYDAALRLWRGTPFGEFAGEWWAVAESARLTERYVVGREERAQCLMALGQHHRAVAELEGLVADHPLRERPVAWSDSINRPTGRSRSGWSATRPSNSATAR
jgi:DNA-binding SARP family transcriptional activator